MHIGVFILLLLSGERNFGVRLNKPYTATVPMDIPVFSGTHADLLITVFHKIIATGHQRLQPLFDCLLTILVNVSPYLKTLSMVAAIKLLHLLEAFSTPWFLFSSPANHHLVFFLLEIFNNIIQYQFDGNSNLVYTIIRKRQVFHALANIPSDMSSINKCLSSRKLSGRFQRTTELMRKIEVDEEPEVEIDETEDELEEIPEVVKVNKEPSEVSDEEQKSETIEESMEGSRPALPAEPGTLKATLLETPSVVQMTEKESAHPTAQLLDKIAKAEPSNSITDITNGETDMNIENKTTSPAKSPSPFKRAIHTRGSIRVAHSSISSSAVWRPTPEWVQSEKTFQMFQANIILLDFFSSMASQTSFANNHETASGSSAASRKNLH